MYLTQKHKKYAIQIVVLLFAIILEVTKAEVTQGKNTTMDKYRNGCGCIHYDCGCCEYLEWHAVSLNGRFCGNASYLDHDYGISLTVTFNDATIINETVSARNPPPICIGEDVVENLKAEVCLRLYDININKSYYHGCFELEARIAKLNILPLQLGCFETNHKPVPSSDVPLTSHAILLQTTACFSILSIILSNIMISNIL